MAHTFNKVISVMLMLMLCACGQWKLSALKGKKLCTISGGSAPGNVVLDFNESGALDVSFLIRVFNGKIYAADNISKRLMVFDLDGTPLLLIGQKDEKEQQGVKIRNARFNFSVIGSIAVDSNDNIYIQNRLLPAGNPQRAEGTGEIDSSPSYILVFDKEGNLQHAIGQKGTADIPFYYIERLEVDKTDRLFIASRSFDNWNVFRFSGKKRDFFINLGSIEFKDTEENETFVGKIESVKSFKTGDNFLIAVAYYHNNRFKYRKIFDYSIAEGKMSKAVIKIPDPKNELFTLIDDKNILLWNVEGKKIKFAIINFDGNVINNILLEMQSNKSYEDIFTDETGQLYSLHVGKKDIDIMEWK